MDYNSVHRRESIVLTAIDFIHRYGIHSVSTKEIAKKLGISESTIFKHFRKKTDLLMAVLEQFSLYDNDIFSTAAAQEKKPREAIIFYIDSYAVYYENYPEVTALVQVYDVFRGVSELEEKSKNILLSRLEYMSRLIKKAQDGKMICKDADAESLANVFNSTFRGICLKWRMKNFGFSLREEAIKATNMLLDAFGH